MIRAQCLVYRGRQILMVKHHFEDVEWWCLPGGGVESDETPPQAALRELEEECHVSGKIIRQVGDSRYADGIVHATYLVDIDSDEPAMGADPEFSHDEQIIVEMRWLTLAEIPERDRAYLWAAGLMSVPIFQEEISTWGDALSYPHV